MSNPISFMVVDEDRDACITLRKTIMNNFEGSECFVAYDGLKGWESLLKNDPQIILINLSMPGMNGIQFLKKLRENDLHKNCIVLMLLTNLEKSQREKVIEEGADDFLVKPFSPIDLVAKLKLSKKLYNINSQKGEDTQLIFELAAELRQDIQDMRNITANCLDARMPYSKPMLEHAAKAAIWVAKQLGIKEEDELDDVETAARLCWAGKMFLSDQILRDPIMIKGKVMEDMMHQVPSYTKEIISGARRFQDAAKIAFHVYENLDGSGIPERLKSWQIPLSSRIIRVAVDYEEIRRRTKLKSRQVIDNLRAEANRLYDHRCVTLFEQFIAYSGADDSNVKERDMNLDEMKPGMTLSRDIMTTSGIKLVASGTELKENVIRIVTSHNISDPILGCIFVYDRD